MPTSRTKEHGGKQAKSKGAATSVKRETIRPGDKAGEKAKSNPTGGNQ